MTVTAEESCTNIRTVKAFACEEGESAKFSRDNQKVFEQGKRKALINGLQLVSTTVFLYLTLAAILHVSKRLFVEGKVRIGDVSAFMMYVLQIIWQQRLLLWSTQEIMQLQGASDRVVEIMSAQV